MATMFPIGRPARPAQMILLGVLSLAFAAVVPSAQAAVVLSGTGVGVNPISARAVFSFGTGTAANVLDITLVNTSTVATRYPADVLTSLYFDIRSGTSRPNLQYLGAGGQVYQVKSGTADAPYVYFPPATSGTAFQPGVGTSNLRAQFANDATWQYRALNSGSAPFLGFGVGTVGNSGSSSLVAAPNTFQGSVVGQGDFGIYAGEAATLQNQLENRFLVSGSATFRFLVLGSGTTSYGEGHIVRSVVFGFGTSPDAVIHVPEPAGLAACGLLGLACFGALARPRGGRGLWLAGGFALVAIAALLVMPDTVAPIPVGDVVEGADRPRGRSVGSVVTTGVQRPAPPVTAARKSPAVGRWLDPGIGGSCAAISVRSRETGGPVPMPAGRASASPAPPATGRGS